MNSQDFRTLILMKKPRYAKSRIPFIETFANKGKSKSEYSQFGPIYELYIYAFVLGVKLDARLPIPRENNLTKDFVEIAKWKGGGSLVDFLLMIVFSKSEEIGLDWNELEDLDESALKNKINHIISFIEDYANGGLQFLETQYKEDRLINSPYLFIDLLAEHSEFDVEKENELEELEIIETTEELNESTKRKIETGENKKIEFKSTLRVNLRTKQPDEKMEHECMKTIAAFMNTSGGTLFIGIADSREILGLETDFNSFRKEDKLDQFQKHFDNLIEKGLGNGAYALLGVSFHDLEYKKICRIDVKPKTSGPAYLKNKGKEELYIRRAASTISLQMREAQEYIKVNWS